MGCVCNDSLLLGLLGSGESGLSGEAAAESGALEFGGTREGCGGGDEIERARR